MLPSTAADLDCLRRAWSNEYAASTTDLQAVLDRMSEVTASILRSAAASEPIPPCDADLLSLTFAAIETHYAEGGATLCDLPDQFRTLQLSPLDRAIIALRATALSNTINQAGFFDRLPEQVALNDLAQAAAGAPVEALEPTPGSHYITFDAAKLTTAAIAASSADDDLDAVIATQRDHLPHPALLHFAMVSFLEIHDTDCAQLAATPPTALARWLIDGFDLGFATAHRLSLRMLALAHAVCDYPPLAARLTAPHRSYAVCRAAAALSLQPSAQSPAPTRFDVVALRALLRSSAWPQ